MIFFCNVTIAFPYQNNNKRNNFQIVITLQLSILRPVWCICNFCVYLSWFANWFSNKQLAFGNSSSKLNVYLFFSFLLRLEWNMFRVFNLSWETRKNNICKPFIENVKLIIFGGFFKTLFYVLYFLSIF